ncbi:MAG TPA: gamma-glutamyl-gamma-aminobutyrate hydrolase family protein [Candidatus Aminicenantes bacterium]|nr:gamma-glutamyl-gamma-aminobutyrate hydrolase family protein [Candidatus Aminicenantes bacterium]
MTVLPRRGLGWIVGLLCLAVAVPAAAAGEPPVPVLVMTRPTISQIRNVIELFERDFLSLPRLSLLCVTSDAEESDYRSAREFVQENHLDWIRFQTIHGRVEADKLFQENEWTAQFRDLVAVSDGLLLPGGADMPPALYGEPTGLLTNPTTPRRSMFEVSFLFQLLGGSRNPGFSPLLARRPSYLVLAICLGCQSLNVAAGGTMVQDIPREIYGLETAEEVLALGADRITTTATSTRPAPASTVWHPLFTPSGWSRDDCSRPCRGSTNGHGRGCSPPITRRSKNWGGS